MSESSTISTAVGECLLRRSNRRTLAISVHPDGTVELTAPKMAAAEAITAKVAKRVGWIRLQRQRFAEMNRDRLPLRYVSGASHRYLGRQYRLKVQKAEPTEVRLVGGYFLIRAKSGDQDEVRALLEQWFRKHAQALFAQRLSQWSEWCRARELPEPRLSLLKMPKRWGSAQPDGRIRLNPELIRMPSICIDYVVAHEICHLRFPAHDPRFYRQLSELMPDWRKIKARLESEPL